MQRRNVSSVSEADGSSKKSSLKTGAIIEDPHNGTHWKLNYDVTLTEQVATY